MPTLHVKILSSCLSGHSCRTGGSPAARAVFIIEHPAFLETVPSGLQLFKSHIHLQPASIWHSSERLLQIHNSFTHCKSTETKGGWVSTKLAGGGGLERRGRYEMKISGQETSLNLCQTEVKSFPTAEPLRLKAPLQYLFPLGCGWQLE